MRYREGLCSYENIINQNDKELPRKLNSFWEELVLLDGSLLYYNEYSSNITNIFQNHEE